MDINEIRQDRELLEADIMDLIRRFNNKYEAYPVMSLAPITSVWHLTNYNKDVIAVESVNVAINPIGV